MSIALSTPRSRAAGLALVVLLCAGCPWRQMTSRAPIEGFEPLREAMTAQVPHDTSTSPNVTTGHEGGTYWADARVMVHANAADVCAALADPATVVNDRAVDEWRVESDAEADALPGDHGFVLVNTVKRAATITFSLAWRFVDLEDGCVARWSLQRAPVIISSNRGWVSVTALDDGLTLVEIQSELAAPRVDESVPRAYLELLTEKLRARACEE
jgi:hypothetical protein